MIFAMDNIAVDLWLDVVGRATFLKLTYRCEGNVAAGRGQGFGGKSSDDALRFQPFLPLGFVRSSNHRHRHRVDAADVGGTRHRRQETERVARDLALSDPPDGRPVGPEAGEGEERAAFVGSEPHRHLLAVDGVIFGEAGERRQAAVLRTEPALPVPLFRLQMF
jgi:hypothetical protein